MVEKLKTPLKYQCEFVWFCSDASDLHPQQINAPSSQKQIKCIYTIPFPWVTTTTLPPKNMHAKT